MTTTAARPESHLGAGVNHTAHHRTEPAAFEQIDLLDLLAGPPGLAEKFRRFHRNNPHVYATLVALARQWKASTASRVGIAALFERARWELAIETTDAPRLNNSYRAFYARLIMDNEPDLSGLFEVRRSAADLAVLGG